MTTWHEQITKALVRNGETWRDVEAHTMPDEDLYRDFDNGFGFIEGAPFTLWTRHHVYFRCV